MEIERLTIKQRLILCWQILTTTSGHAHSATEKNLLIFQKGYSYGLIDGNAENENFKN